MKKGIKIGIKKGIKKCIKRGINNPGKTISGKNWKKNQAERTSESCRSRRPISLDPKTVSKFAHNHHFRPKIKFSSFFVIYLIKLIRLI